MPHLPDAPQRRLFVVGSFVEAHCWFVPRRPGSDESQQASVYTHECAGKGLAVALGAHRLGAAVDMLLAVGHDPAGDTLLQLLGEEGLGTAHVHRLGPHSGQGCGLIDAQGDPAIAVYPGANALLSERELRHARVCVEQAAVAYAQLEVPLPLAAQALHWARAAGAATVLNPSPWPGDAACAGLLDAAGILVVNRGEAQCLLRSLGLADALDAAPPPSFWGLWPAGQWLVITLGSQGCVAHARSGAVRRLPGHPVPAMQPVGAGDAFSAGLCTALAHGQPMAQALALGNACGALAASRGGILTTLPCMAEAQTLLNGKTSSG